MASRSGVEIHTTIYGTFKGADFSTDPSLVDARRSPLCTNMVADAGGMPEKRVGWRVLHNVGGGRVNGLYSGKFGGALKMLAHIGAKLYAWDETDTDPILLLDGLHDGASQGVLLGGKLWIVTGGEMLCYDGTAAKNVTASDDVYIPTTVISRDPAGGGQPYEDVNLLGRYRKNSFLADGTSTEYLLDGSIDAAGAIIVKVNGAEMRSGWTAKRTDGKIVFETAPEKPEAGQADNVEITYPHTVSGYADRVKKCTIITAYGIGATNRIVISGNPDYPNLDWTSGLNDPTYIPDLSYAAVGLEGVAIMGYCRIGEYLGIVKEENAQDSSVWIRSGSLDSDGNPVFTIKAALSGVGAVSKAGFASLLDEPLFLSGTGVYALSTTTYNSGKITQNRSWFLNSMLTREAGLTTAAAVQWNGMYLLAAGNGVVYVLDGKQEKSYRRASLSDFIYEGYYWDGIPAVCWMNRKDGALEHLYFGTEDGRICRMNNDWDDMQRFSDDGKAITAIWCTKVDDDGDATVLKTMIKRGASVTIKPNRRTSAKVYVIRDEDTEKLVASGSMGIFSWDDMDFTDFTFETYDGPKDIMLNTKVKKYKRLQIAVINDTVDQGFGVFAITKHYVGGNYAKR